MTNRSIEDDVDRLFSIPLTEFTGARNGLAAMLKKSGRHDEAASVKALMKPSISAWAVNQLYWKHREAFERLIAAGQSLRQAQALQLRGKAPDMRGPQNARGEAISNLLRLAAGLLDDSGHHATPNTMRRITTTLEAMSAYASLPNAPTPGRLTDDIDPPGFEALAALMPLKEPTVAIDLRVMKKSFQAGTAAAQASLRDAERALEQARSRVQDVDAALNKALADANEAEERFHKARAAWQEAADRAHRLEAEAREAAETRENAARAVEKAAAALQEETEL